jgi:hypothetical protein
LSSVTSEPSVSPGFSGSDAAWLSAWLCPFGAFVRATTALMDVVRGCTIADAAGRQSGQDAENDELLHVILPIMHADFQSAVTVTSTIVSQSNIFVNIFDYLSTARLDSKKALV